MEPNEVRIAGLRKITRETCGAFVARKSKRIANTESDGDTLWLHGNGVARWYGPNRFVLFDAGWRTRATKDRLNGVLTMVDSSWRIAQVKKVWWLYNWRHQHVEDILWDGSMAFAGDGVMKATGVFAPGTVPFV